MTHILGQDLPCSLKHLKKLEKNIWNSGQLKDKDPWKAGNSRSFSKESICNAGDPSLIPGSGRAAGEGIDYLLQYSWASLVAQLVKNPPVMQETWVQSLGWEDPLEKGRTTRSSVLVWWIPLCSAWGHRELDVTEHLSLSLLAPLSALREFTDHGAGRGNIGGA